MHTMSNASWQPIETAPKDGTRVLLFGPDQWVGWFISEEDDERDEDGEVVTGWTDESTSYEHRWTSNAPTHWMLLPAPPEPTDAQ